jgi:hypothetical protein
MQMKNTGWETIIRNPSDNGLDNGRRKLGCTLEMWMPAANSVIFGARGSERRRISVGAGENIPVLPTDVSVFCQRQCSIHRPP